jgi:hypothetical protein
VSSHDAHTLFSFVSSADFCLGPTHPTHAVVPHILALFVEGGLSLTFPYIYVDSIAPMGITLLANFLLGVSNPVVASTSISSLVCILTSSLAVKAVSEVKLAISMPFRSWFSMFWALNVTYLTTASISSSI